MFNYGFFNSVNGDRVYNADTMSSIFEGLITDGVFYGVGDKMAVQPNSGMTIQIASGRGWFNKRWAVNTTPYLLTLEASDVTLNRYAAVVIKVDSSESVRSVAPYIKYGQYAINPVKPTMTRSETVNEYCLAYVYIGAGVTAITSANIEDARADENVCGWVTGLIDQLDSNTLFTQFTAIFNEWFSGLQDDLNPNTEAMLVAALPQSLTVTLTVAGWVAGESGYTQSVTVVGMNSTKSIIVTPVEASEEAYNTANVRGSSQSTNTLTFHCDELPTEELTVQVLHLGQ